MYQILIADDDENIRKGLAKAIKDYFKDDVTISEAGNGYTALDEMSACETDIMIADIKMPLCDGIELIRTAKERKYRTKIVVLSGFNDYSLVRSALTLGAVDYLLKPINLKEFRSVLYKLRESVDEDRKNIFSAPFEATAEGAEQQQMLEYLLGLRKEENVSIRLLTEIHHLFAYEYAFLCLVDLGSILCSEKNHEIKSLSSKVISFFDTKNELKTLQGEIDNLWVLICFSQKSNIRKSLGQLPELLNSLEKNGYKMGYELQFVPVGQLCLQKKACIKALERYYFNLSCEEQFDTGQEKYDNVLEEALQLFINNDSPIWTQKIEHAFEIINYSKPPISEFKFVMSNLIHKLMLQDNSYIKIIGKYQFTDHNIIEAIDQSKDLCTLKNSVINILSFYYNEHQCLTPNDEDYIIKKAKKYINDNYSKDISLKGTASNVFLNPNYFSTIFKKKNGISFREYVREQRINQAKKLIETTNLTYFEISQQVGYSETTHFFRAFKTVTGKTPEEYKKSVTR